MVEIAEPEPTIPIAEFEPDLAPQAEEAVREFNMVSKKFDFEPSTITVEKGAKVRINLTSTDVAHGFAISEFNVDERIEPGETTVVEFMADQVGTFPFICSVFCGSGHRGMQGTLIVTE